ncbi:F-box/kelch-repeat protein At3g23880 [Medicago truncatula]|nr:F-box/kelch-repeat protein At3g23880 [Medicago truncatula]
MDSPPPKSLHSNSCSPTSVLFDELITEILSWLPVKTLMQFKCVCKSWTTLISHDPSFTKLHLYRSRRNTHLALFSDQLISDIRVQIIPVSRLLENMLRNIAIPNDPYYSISNTDCFFVVGSCNGLLFLQGNSLPIEPHNVWLRFWNPATKTLSEKIGYSTKFFKLTFGYDISNDTYKVVSYNANEVKVFSLSDNVWRDIPSLPIVPHQSMRDGVYVSGSINWLAIQNITKYKWNDIRIEQFVIISLDLGTETYQQFLPPRGFVEVPPAEPSVTVLMDCLCFSHNLKRTHFVLWQMMEFGVEESWTPFLKISFQDLHIDYNDQLFVLPLCVSKISDTIIMVSNQDPYDNQHLFVYNWRDKRVEHIKSVNNRIWWFFARNYVESLVSTS